MAKYSALFTAISVALKIQCHEYLDANDLSDGICLLNRDRDELYWLAAHWPSAFCTFELNIVVSKAQRGECLGENGLSNVMCLLREDRDWLSWFEAHWPNTVHL